MKSEFITKPLSEIADIQTGPFGSQLHKKDYVQVGTPIVTVEHLGKKAFTKRNLPCVSNDDKERLSKYILQEGDIVFSRVGSVDRCSYVSHDYDGWLFSGRCLRVRPLMEIDPQYLYYFFTLESTKQFVRGIATGATMPSINTKFMGEIPIVYPKIDVQRKIASIFNLIDDKIELNRNINENLEQQAQALYHSWFINYEHFGGVKPNDWKDGTIDELGAEIICGKTPSTKKTEYYGGNTPFITIPDMHGCVYNVSTERYLSSAGVASQPKKCLPPNTVCVSCIGTAGLVTLVSEESQSNQQINSIVPQEGISAYYIYLLMKTLSETINKFGQSGSTIVNLNKTQFGKIQVMIPSKDVMQEFDFLCKPIFETIHSNQKENVKLSKLRDTLLPKLMSGELSISNLNF